MAPGPSDDYAAGLVYELERGDSQRAWSEFLRAYAEALARVVSYCEREEENRADAFVFICEELHRDNCRRLRRFDPHGAASFATWLHAVARNLCRDWRRKQFGRPPKRDPTSNKAGPQLSRVVLSDCLSLDDDAESREVSDLSPSPEVLADTHERHLALARAMALLSPQQRVAISLRIEEELTLREIASIMRLPNAQAADRLVRSAVQALRSSMNLRPRPHGKAQSTSV